MSSLGPATRSLLTAIVAAVLTAGLLAGAPASGARPAVTQSSPTTRDVRPDPARYAKCWKQHRRCFTAISLNTITGKKTWSINRATKKKAVRQAHRRCLHNGRSAGCVKAGWVRNGWIAVAYRIVNGRARDWASGVRYGETAARKRARNRLVGPGRRKYWTWAGTDRGRQYKTRGRESFGQW
ncbi:DUF4189 domain-containing protein [Nocardioidaceae bacterium SCSIO 66511]|nr:DUF4189 domain-containing protein [Nocardioidaceae bacterium SCSIO 66511]